MSHLTNKQEIDILKEQIAALQFQQSIHQTLILGLLSELGADNLSSFNPFTQTIRTDLDAYPPNSDEHYDFMTELNKYIDRAIHESKSCPVI